MTSPKPARSASPLNYLFQKNNSKVTYAEYIKELCLWTKSKLKQKKSSEKFSVKELQS